MFYSSNVSASEPINTVAIIPHPRLLPRNENSQIMAIEGGQPIEASLVEGKPPDKLRGFKLKSNFKFQAGASGS